MPTSFAGPARRLLRFLIAVLVVAAIPVVAGAVLFHRVTQPKGSGESQDPAELLLHAEEASLYTSDGLVLSGWFIRGRPKAPPIILCHDLGGSRSDLLNAAVVLNKAGYPLLLLDFRRHGGSASAPSTLGVKERLDVLAAVQFLKQRREVDAARLGGWGVGMGAYALALAALETPALQTLALDSLYPDVPSEVDRLVRRELPPALHPLVSALRVLYDPLFRLRLDRFALRDRVGELGGRNLLLIAASENPDRFEEEKLLYEALPEGPKGGRNLLELRRSGLKGLYAEDRTKYDQTILGFFSTYLPSGKAGQARAGAFEVIER